MCYCSLKREYESLFVLCHCMLPTCFGHIARRIQCSSRRVGRSSSPTHIERRPMCGVQQIRR